MNEKVSDQTLHDYIIASPRSNFDIAHNAAFNELLAARETIARLELELSTTRESLHDSNVLLNASKVRPSGEPTAQTNSMAGPVLAGSSDRCTDADSAGSCEAGSPAALIEDLRYLQSSMLAMGHRERDAIIRRAIAALSAIEAAR